MAGSASTETAGTVILSAATATPQDIHAAALSRFEVVRKQFLKEGASLRDAETRAAAQVDRTFNTHLSDAIPSAASTEVADSTTTQAASPAAPSSTTASTPIYDRYVRSQFQTGPTPLYDTYVSGSGYSGTRTPLYNRYVGEGRPTDTMEAMRQRPDFPIHFPEEEHAGPFAGTVQVMAKGLMDTLQGSANLLLGPPIPSSFTGKRFLGIARQADIERQLGPQALNFTDEQMAQNRTAAAFIASSLVGGVTADAILEGLQTPTAAMLRGMTGATPRLGIVGTALSGTAAGAAFGALRPKDQQESLLGAILSDALLFGGMSLAGGLVGKVTRPVVLGVDGLEAAGIHVNEAARGTRLLRARGIASGTEYGKALFEEVQGIAPLTTEGDLSRVPDVALGDLDMTMAQVPANIGFFRRYFGSPSLWRFVGGIAGEAAERITNNAGQRMAVALREYAAWRNILDETEHLISKDLPSGPLMGEGAGVRAALIQQRKDALGKLLDNVFQPVDLPVTTPPNMVRAFTIIRSRLLADREALRLTVGGVADWGIDAYLAHVHIGDWALMNAATNKILAITKIGEWRTAAGRLIADQPELAGNMRLVPKRYIMPAELSGLGMTGRQIGMFISRAASMLSVDQDEIASVLFENRIARVKPGKKWFGHTQGRGEPALEGFETDPFVALRMYAAGATRKIAFHDFEQKAGAILDELGRTGGLEPSVSALRGYVDRVMGRPSQLEESVRVTLQSMARFATKPFGPGVQEVAAEAADVRRILGRVNQFEAMSRLGYSPIAWYTNLTQTLTNTSSAIGWGPTMRGVRLFLDRSQRPQVDALLRALDIDLAVPLSSADDILAKNVGQVSPFHPLYLFNKIETANRAIAALAKYQEQLLKGADIRQALDASRQFVRETQFDYSMADTPALLQGPLGSTIFQFKKFAIKELEFIWGLRSNPAALARFHANVWAVGGTTALFALPPYMLLNWAEGYMTGETLNEKLQAAYPRAARGLPGFAGVDLGGNIAVGLPRDTGDLFGPGLADIWTTVRDIAGKPIMDLVRGKQGHLTPADRAQAIAAVVPVAVRRLMDAYDVLESGVVRARGTTQLKYTSESVAREATLLAFGFRSLANAEEQRVTTTIRRQTELHNRDEQAAVQAWAMAYVSGRSEEATKILQDAQADGLVLTHEQLRDALAGALLERSTRAVLKSPPELRLQELQRIQQLQPRP